MKYNMKQYYATIDTCNSPQNMIQYWVGDSSRAITLTKLNKLVLPLGTRKPRNVSRETLKQF